MQNALRTRAASQPPRGPEKARPLPFEAVEQHTARVRALCLAQPHATERLSHGEPTFFVAGKVFAMMSTDHHDDGRLAVVLPLADGEQETLLRSHPRRYFYPPYVGVRGWIGLHLARVGDALLRRHIEAAWRLVAPKRLVAQAPRPIAPKSTAPKTSSPKKARPSTQRSGPKSGPRPARRTGTRTD